MDARILHRPPLARIALAVSCALLLGVAVPCADPVREGASPAPSSPPPAGMSLEEVISLLQAGIGEPLILKQVRSTGTHLSMTTETLLRLKAAGASDAFIEALMPPEDDADAADREPPPKESPPETRPGPEDVLTREESSIRLYVMEDEEGDRIVHITNLDENGRRLGGELPAEARTSRNVIASGQAESAPTRSYSEESAAPPPPVVVNVYPPEPAEPAPVEAFPTGDPDHYGTFLPTGVYPGYFNQAYAPYPYTTWGYPYGRYLGGVVYSPPGSYSHFIRYHRPPGSHVFRRYTGYTVHGTRFNAATRNRLYFNKH